MKSNDSEGPAWAARHELVDPAAELHASHCSHPLVSIIVCTAGRRPFLQRCLESLATHRCDRSEILVVENGPADPELPHLLGRFPVSLLREPRRGVCVARNTAIPKAKGELLVFVDDDVVADSGWLHQLIQGFEDPAVACVTGRTILVGPALLQTERFKALQQSERILCNWTLSNADRKWYETVLREYVGTGCNMAFRKSFLVEGMPFPENMGAGALIPAADELYMFFQVLKRGFRIRHCGGAIVTHFYEEDQARVKDRIIACSSAQVAFWLKLFFEEKGQRSQTARLFLAAAWRFVRRAFQRRTVAGKLREPLSPTEKLIGYARGLAMYWRSRGRDDQPRQRR